MGVSRRFWRLSWVCELLWVSCRKHEYRFSWMSHQTRRSIRAMFTGTYENRLCLLHGMNGSVLWLNLYEMEKSWDHPETSRHNEVRQYEVKTSEGWSNVASGLWIRESCSAKLFQNVQPGDVFRLKISTNDNSTLIKRIRQDSFGRPIIKDEQLESAFVYKAVEFPKGVEALRFMRDKDSNKYTLTFDNNDIVVATRDLDALLSGISSIHQKILALRKSRGEQSCLIHEIRNSWNISVIKDTKRWYIFWDRSIDIDISAIKRRIISGNIELLIEFLLKDFCKKNQ